MILSLLLAATAPALSGPPVLYYAQTRSVAYRDCVAAEHGRRPAQTVEQIGRGRCAAVRGRLFADVHGYVRYGWRGVPKSAGQAKRLKAQHKVNAEREVVRFEGALQAWLSANGASGG